VRQAELQLPSGGALHDSGTSTEAIPVLFLHGVGGGAWSWEPQRAALAATRRVYVWEGRGHGAAARVDDAGLGDYFIDAREALGSVIASERRPVAIVGHSMGGLLALALAAENAAGVAGLGLIDPVYPEDGKSGHDVGPLKPLVRFALGPLARSFAHDGRIARSIARWTFEQSFEDRANMEEAWQQQRTQIPIEYPRMIFEAFEGVVGFPTRPFAREVSSPTLLLYGSAAIKKPRSPELVASLRERLAEEFVYDVIPGGHYLQLDRPAAVTARLQSFLRDFVDR
jgi:3-oxoadipate enol-lactonase